LVSSGKLKKVKTKSGEIYHAWISGDIRVYRDLLPSTSLRMKIDLMKTRREAWFLRVDLDIE